MTQAEIRRSVDVGPGLLQVRTVADWYRTGHFDNDDEARGAFRLAYQQGLDGLGPSIEEWMGLTPEEFNAWMRDEALPSAAKACTPPEEFDAWMRGKALPPITKDRTLKVAMLLVLAIADHFGIDGRSGRPTASRASDLGEAIDLH